jgi:hypothetical protein
MARLQRFNTDGDYDANGEFCLFRDFGRMEDELSGALKRVEQLEAQLVSAKADLGYAAARGEIKMHKQFGYVDPDKARDFLAGRSHEVVVTRGVTDTSIMPLVFRRGPAKFKLDVGRLPHIGCRVYVDGVKGVVKSYSKNDKAVVVALEGRSEHVETINWSLTNDTKRHAKGRSRIHGEVAGCGGGSLDAGAGIVEAAQCIAGG